MSRCGDLDAGSGVSRGILISAYDSVSLGCGIPEFRNCGVPQLHNSTTPQLWIASSRALSLTCVTGGWALSYAELISTSSRGLRALPYQVHMGAAVLRQYRLWLLRRNHTEPCQINPPKSTRANWEE
jgi:hypothetical protein